jgi:hypothetical protein
MADAPRIVVLPPLEGERYGELTRSIAELAHHNRVIELGSIGPELPENAWVAAVCLGIAKNGSAYEPLHLVAAGGTAHRAHAISFAQRAARRSIISYSFIDAIPQGTFVDWPDAPVTIFQSNPLALSDLTNTARLRGWTSIKTDSQQLAADVVKAIEANNP